MNSIALLRRHFTDMGEDPGWPEHGWPTVGDAAAYHDDPRLITLISLYQGGDSRAGLVAVMICLDPLLGRSRRLGLDAGECVSALWLALVRYPVERRRQHVRAGLVLDACRDAARAGWAREIPVDGALLADRAGAATDPDDPDPDPGSVIEAGLRTGILTLDEAAVLHVVHVRRHSKEAVARGLGVSGGKIRRMCDRATRRLAANSATLLAA